MRAATACRGFFATALVQASAGEQQPAVHRGQWAGVANARRLVHATEEILPPADKLPASGFRLAVQTENPHGIMAHCSQSAMAEPR